jgi:hypothetical protein
MWVLAGHNCVPLVVKACACFRRINLELAAKCGEDSTDTHDILKVVYNVVVVEILFTSVCGRIDPVSYIQTVSETGFCLHPQLKPTRLGPVDITSPFFGHQHQ